MRQLKKVNYRKQLKEKYSLGGILKVVQQASPLLNLIPGAGQILAPAVGSAAGMGASAANQHDAGVEQKKQDQQNLSQQQMQGNQMMHQNNTKQMYPPTFPYGGISQGKVDRTKDQVLDGADGSSKYYLKNYNLNDPKLYEDIADDPGAMGSIFNASKRYNSNNLPNDSTTRFMANYNHWAKEAKQPGIGLSHDNGLITNMNPNTKLIGSDMTPEQLKTYPNKYPNGGTINNPYKVNDPNNGNAELEDQEVFRTPQGQMQQVNGKTHAEGGEQYNLPKGTQILGKSKAPNGKMYKEEGEKIMKEYTKYSKILASKPTPIAKKTAQKMLEKAEQKYSQLMQQQEAEKGHFQAQGSTISPPPIHFSKSDTTFNQSSVNKDYKGAEIQSPRDNNGFAYGGTILRNPQYDDGGDTSLLTDDTSALNTLHDTQNNAGFINPVNVNKGFNWNSALTRASAAGSLAPVAYNLGEGIFGKPQHSNPSQFYNPYEGAALSQLQNRKYDVNPEIEANKVATANYYKNMRQSGASAGQYIGGLQAGQVSQQRANSDVYSKANNMNNQYKGEYANALMGAGQQRSNIDYQVDQQNQENIAAQKRYIPTALSQLSQASQVGTQMRNQQQSQDKQNQTALDIYKMKYKNYQFLLEDPEFMQLAKAYDNNIQQPK